VTHRRASGSGQPERRRTIATQLFLAEVAIVMLLTVIASVVALRATRSQVERLSGEKALAIARSVAASPQVRAAFNEEDPGALIQPIAEAVRIRSGADFVVVANRDEIRYSHPDPEKVGEKLSTPAGSVLMGEEFIGTEQGTLGRSVRGKTPVFDQDGQVIGLVSVGLLIEGVQARARTELFETIGWLAGAAVLLGGVGAALVAGRVRKQTYALDAESIGALLEHREAILSSVKEGVVAIDTDRRITLANDEARRLLSLPADCVGRSIDSFGLDGEVVAALTDPTDRPDRPVAAGSSILIANRRAITIRSQERGGIVTLRDRTELDQLTAQLAGTRAVTDTLRAQAHEFSNKIHTIGGLLSLGAYDELASFLDQVGRSHSDLAAAVSSVVRDRRVAALLVVKKTLAAERNVDVQLDPATWVPELSDMDGSDFLVVLGNLIDNALQAVDQNGWITVLMTFPESVLHLRVTDSGPGVVGADHDAIFNEGWTTKATGAHFGLGLALARRLCAARGGSIRLSGTSPTTFEVAFPLQTVRNEALEAAQ
jgi:two-component system, CitB family, sensor kinase